MERGKIATWRDGTLTTLIEEILASLRQRLAAVCKESRQFPRPDGAEGRQPQDEAVVSRWPGVQRGQGRARGARSHDCVVPGALADLHGDRVGCGVEDEHHARGRPVDPVRLAHGAGARGPRRPARLPHRLPAGSDPGGHADACHDRRHRPARPHVGDHHHRHAAADPDLHDPHRTAHQGQSGPHARRDDHPLVPVARLARGSAHPSRARPRPRCTRASATCAARCR